jgi:hypothetical protein
LRPPLDTTGLELCEAPYHSRALDSPLDISSARVTLSLVSQTIAGVPSAGWQRRGALSMSGSLFAELDRFCGQFALALHNTELQVYAVLTLLLVLGILLFPPRNDPDQA